MRVLFVDGRDAACAEIAREHYVRRGGEARAGERPAAGDVAWADLVVHVHDDWGLPEPVGLCREEMRELRASIEKKVFSLPI